MIQYVIDKGKFFFKYCLKDMISNEFHYDVTLAMWNVILKIKAQRTDDYNDWKHLDYCELVYHPLT